jgi:subtilisin-like proprotein convertase family protein
MRRLSPGSFFAFIVALVTLAPAGAASQEMAKLAPRAHPQLLARLEAGASSVPVLVGLKLTIIPGVSMERTPAADQEAARRARHLAAERRVAAAVAGPDFTATRYFENFPMLAGQASSDAVVALANRTDVAWVMLDGRKELLATSPPNQPEQLLVRSPRANSAGFTGAGQTVAVIDSGVDYNVAELGGGGFPNSKVIGGTSPADHTGDPMDCEGHGTSVAAIVAGTAGIAPDAKIVAVKVFPDCFPYAADSDILAGIDYVISNRATFAISAINMSLGVDLSEGAALGYCDALEPAYASAFDAANAAGIAVVVAAGNGAQTNALSSPACVSGAISVGAVYAEQIGHVDWGLCSDDAIQPDRPTCFSNANQNLSLYAPGAFWNVVTVGGSLQSFSGTSAASPAAAGAVAVLKQAQPSLSPRSLLGLLSATGNPVKSDGTSGLAPRVDVYAATQLMSAAYVPFTGSSVEIPDGSGAATAAVTVSGFDAPLGSVQAWVQIDHSDPTQLLATLSGPDGTTVVLHDHTGAAQHPINTVYGRNGASAFALSAFEGRPSNGVWTLTVQDTVTGTAGRIRNFALSLIPGQPHVPLPAGTDGFVIPSVSRSDQDQLSSADLRLYNPGPDDRTFDIFFVPKGQTGDQAVRSTRTVGAGVVLALDDVLFSEFGYTQASGQLTISSDDDDFFASSRSFVDATTGSFGTLVPGQPIGWALTPGSSATLPALTRTSFVHSDAGFVEVSGAPATVLFTVRDAAGTYLGSSQQLALPNQFVLFPDPIRYLGLALTDSYRVDASIVGGSGAVVPAAWTTDDRTADPAFEAAIQAAPPSTDDWILPYAVSDSTGVDQTDLTIVNLGASAASVTVTATPPVVDGEAPPTLPQTYTVGPGQTLTRGNILLSDFGFSSDMPAALRIHTDAPAQLAVTARRSHAASWGAYGMTEEAVAQPSALSGDQTATSIHMDQNGQTQASFGFVEVAGQDVIVHVSVVDGSTGSELGAQDYPVQGGNEFFGDAEDILGATTASNIYFRFSLSSGDGAVVAYGLATEVVSGDTNLVIARQDP